MEALLARLLGLSSRVNNIRSPGSEQPSAQGQPGPHVGVDELWGSTENSSSPLPRCVMQFFLKGATTPQCSIIKSKQMNSTALFEKPLYFNCFGGFMIELTVPGSKAHKTVKQTLFVCWKMSQLWWIVWSVLKRQQTANFNRSTTYWMKDVVVVLIPNSADKKENKHKDAHADNN